MLLLFVYEQFGEREKVEENISVHLIVLTFWVFALNSLTVDKILYCPYYTFDEPLNNTFIYPCISNFLSNQNAPRVMEL